MVTPPCRSRPSTTLLATMDQIDRPRMTRMMISLRTVTALMLPSRCSGRLGVAVGLDAALLDARRLAALAAQVVELGAPHLALAPHLHARDQRRVVGEDALDALARHHAAHGERAPGAATLDRDHVADELLDALLGFLVLAAGRGRLADQHGHRHLVAHLERGQLRLHDLLLDG